MTEAQIIAVVAKNAIAREIRNQKFNSTPIDLDFVIDCLKEIESYTGAGNLPYVIDVVEDVDCSL